MPPLANNSTHHSTKKYLWLLPVVAFWLLVAILLGAYRTSIRDWWQLRGYAAPATVSQIAQDDTLTPMARRVFYVNHPQVAAKTVFAGQCPSGTEQTVVLGCYHGNQAGIYVLAVDDPRLAGIEQVTAAHELLHAAYDRLSPHDRQQVDGWLEDYYRHDLQDQTIKEQIAAYQKSEPRDVVNEMHSLFGTQLATLPPQLEHYYQRYFTSREAVVHYYSSYQAEFTSRQQAVKADDAQLAIWKVQLADDAARLKTANIELQTRQTQLNSLRSSNPAGYNQAVPGYNAAVDGYNDQVAVYKALVDQYNDLVAKRNAIVLEAQQLTQEISSQVSPVGR